MTTEQPTVPDLEKMYGDAPRVRQSQPGTIREQTTQASGRDQIADRIGVTFKFVNMGLSYSFDDGWLVIVPTRHTDEYAAAGWQEFSYCNTDHVAGLVERWLTLCTPCHVEAGNVWFIAETKNHNNFMSLRFRPNT